MNEHQSDEEVGGTGWIAMCDVYLLFSAVLLAMCVAVAGVAVQLGIERDEGLYMIAALGGASDAEPPAEAELVGGSEAAEESSALTQEDSARTIAAVEAELVAAAEALVAEQAARAELAGRVIELEAALRQDRLVMETLSATHRDLVDVHAEVERTLATLRSELLEAQSRESAMARELAASLADLTVISADRDATALEARRLRAELGARQMLPETERRVRSELLGLRGPLNRTVFLVDRSSSMSGGGRWDDAIATMRTWLELLPVQEAALVTFGSTVDAFPADGQMLVMDDSGRRLLIERLIATRPSGATDTSAALAAAYRYAPADAFVLFTDGAPNPGQSGGPGRGDVRAVLELITREREHHPNLRIHTVGIGDYFSSSMRDFLLGAASRTDGTFIGR